MDWGIDGIWWVFSDRECRVVYLIYGCHFKKLTALTPPNKAWMLRQMTPDPASSAHMPRMAFAVGELQQLTQLVAALSGAPPFSFIFVRKRRSPLSRTAVGALSSGSRDSFCRFALSQPEPTVIEDADRHPEWASSPLVAGPWQFKFLAGFPIRGKQGELMGLLTLLDPQNLHLDSAVLQALGIVARQAASAILLGDTRARISSFLTSIRRSRGPTTTQSRFITISSVFPSTSSARIWRGASPCQPELLRSRRN